MLKIRLNVSSKNYEEIKKHLVNGDVVFCEDEDALVLFEATQKSSYICGKSVDETKLIPIADIIYVECDKHNVMAHTLFEQTDFRDTLTNIESQLPKDKFMRISSSAIIRFDAIVKIVALPGLKHKVIMSNGNKLYVTRSYYKQFKSRVGF